MRRPYDVKGECKNPRKAAGGPEPSGTFLEAGSFQEGVALAQELKLRAGRPAKKSCNLRQLGCLGHHIIIPPQRHLEMLPATQDLAGLVGA